MKNNVIYSLLVLIILPTIICAKLDQRLIVKRNNNNPSSIENTDYPDDSKYSEYTVVPKRAALLFDQLMIALQKVVDNQGRGNIGNSKSLSRAVPLQVANSQIQSSDEQTMDLQRRGQAKSRVYWRCYFNAVTCFKKK
ncbi:uncharacterized protein LOC122519629 [Polistes fuscatus]|uniref:uncharacterized protein LOC122519629 n=1 Tax=Polistes fuscatus TaxID=30207 RepID=UPI001CA89C7B|nr:uncharacterized protein LOC122519629 [Polistes fuscatus]